MRTRAWPVEAGEPLTIDTPLLIADGHHRYETAVAYRAENPEATHTFAVLVSSRAPGLEIFPTHRLVQRARRRARASRSTRPNGGVTLYRDGQLHSRRDRRRLRAAGRRVVRARGRLVHRVRRRGDRRCRPRRGGGRVPARARHGRPGRAVRPRRRGDAAEVDVLLPEAHLRAALPPGLTERLARAVPRRARRRRARARRAAGPRRARAGRRRRRGRRRDDGDRRGGRARDPRSLQRTRTCASSARRSGIFGDGRWTVVVDPIDGSLNAKRGIPFFSISIAVADGGHDGRRRLRLRPRLRHAARSGPPRAAAARS